MKTKYENKLKYLSQCSAVMPLTRKWISLIFLSPFHFYKPFISSVFYDKVTFDVDYGFS